MANERGVCSHQTQGFSPSFPTSLPAGTQCPFKRANIHIYIYVYIYVDKHKYI